MIEGNVDTITKTVTEVDGKTTMTTVFEIAKEVFTQESWVFRLVFGFTMLWALLVVIFIIIMVLRFTLNKNMIKEGTYREETMSMPRGTVRFILTITLLFSVILMEVINNVYEITVQIERIMDAFHMVLAFYFGGNIISTVANPSKPRQAPISQSTSTTTARSTSPSTSAAPATTTASSAHFDQEAQG